MILFEMTFRLLEKGFFCCTVITDGGEKLFSNNIICLIIIYCNFTKFTGLLIL